MPSKRAKVSGEMNATSTNLTDIPTQEQGMSQNMPIATSYRLNYRHDLTGLKAMPPGSYERIKLKNGGEQKGSTTHFICKYLDCNRIFSKSTSLIVHYLRHIDVRPFSCNYCGMSFTQSGTL